MQSKGGLNRATDRFVEVGWILEGWARTFFRELDSRVPIAAQCAAGPVRPYLAPGASLGGEYRALQVPVTVVGGVRGLAKEQPKLAEKAGNVQVRVGCETR